MKTKSLFLSLLMFLTLTAFTASVTVAIADAAGSGRTTRDLVFEDEEEDESPAAAAAANAGIENPEVISVKTTFDLTKDGETFSVPSDYEFTSGEKIKLRYTTNADGYAYWLAKMSSGQYTILFPSAQAGTDNFVKRNENQTVPIKGHFRFDDTAGSEELLLVFATEKIPELEQAVAAAAGDANVVKDMVAKVSSLETQSKRKTRDLVFEDEDEEVNTKTQAGAAGEPFVAYYQLKHK
jgi:Sec-independent protein translocase protein TatA